MSSWHEGEVALGDITLRYYRTGGAKPPVVLAHGMTDNARYWSRVARALERDYDVVMYDARGHGRSTAPEQGYAPADYAADLRGLVAALDLGRPAIVGHSMGANVAAVAAATYPDLARCVVLEDPPWRADAGAARGEQLRAFAEGWRADIAGMKGRAREELVARCRAEHPAWSEEDCGYWADSKLEVSERIFQGFAAMMTPWEETARRIACPALLMTGDPELGGIVTPEVAREFERLAPRGRALAIPGAGHAIHREQLDAFVGAVAAFLRET